MLKIKRLFKSFKYALSGLHKVFWEEQNFRIDTLAVIIVLAGAIYLQLEAWDFMILIILIALVLILEIINSILERLLDLIKPRLHQYVKDIKDMSAAVVLIAAVMAIWVGILIFTPYIIARFFS